MTARAARRRSAPARIAAVVIAALLAAPAAGAQDPSGVPERPSEVNLGGPRFGFTLLTGALVDTARARADVGPVFTQFGWQWERAFYAVEGGPRALNEIVVLIGGLDQGTVIPSASWIVGLRLPNGAELGVGPNVSPSGAALAMVAGVTVRAGYLHVPFNLAVVPSKLGTRFSLLTGFNYRR